MKRGNVALLVLAGAAFLTAMGMQARPDEEIKTGEKDWTVTLYLSTDCPVAARYTPRINKLVDDFGDRFEFVGLFPNEGETERKVGAYVSERSYTFPTSLDVGGVQAKAQGIEIVPTAVITDKSGNILYRGAIDDAKVDDLVRNQWLRDALTQIEKGAKPEEKFTEPFGCFLMAGEAPPAMAAVNYAEHVKTIVDNHCVECHRPGETAPFSLVGYDNARKWSKMIAWSTENRIMPPWLAVEGIGEFHDENRLTPVQIETLKNWDAAGAPRGDAKKEPKTPEFPVGWALGEPDMLLQMPTEFNLGAEGQDEYWNFVIDPKLTEEVYVKALDVRPGNRAVVHHVIAFLDETDKSAKQLQKPGSRDGGYLTFGGVGFAPDGSLGGWAPGVKARRLPQGASFKLKPGTKIVLQVHYHKSGKPETDQTKVALYFDKEKPSHPVEIAWIANPLINIPPNNAAAKFRWAYPIRSDVRLYSLMPHMHLLGKEMKATLIHPDETEEPLIYVDKWDFNWQLIYQLKEPKLIKAGSKILVEAVFDNSADNPNNPNDPPKTVRWGEATTDEMMLLVAAYSPVP